MTSQNKSDESSSNPVNHSKDVLTFLESHPDFFQDHPELLLELKVPHPAGGAVSLIERQVALLRDENKQLRVRIKELVEIARENETLVNKLHSLSLDLFNTKTLDDFSSVLAEKLRSNFKASHVSIKLFREEMPEDYLNAQLENSDSNSSQNSEQMNIVSKSDKSMGNFEKFLRHKTPVCGRFNSQQLAFLFGDKALEVKSLALIPLSSGGGSGEGGEKTFGMFAIGSIDSEHFKAGMSTSLLASLADVASSVVKRHI